MLAEWWALPECRLIIIINDEDAKDLLCVHRCTTTSSVPFIRSFMCNSHMGMGKFMCSLLVRVQSTRTLCALCNERKFNQNKYKWKH